VYFSILLSRNSRSSRCLAHVVNLANIAVMSHITKIGAVETTSAIWEYNPDLADNRVLGGSLDVISAIRTLAVKIQASSQRIEYFYKVQVDCGITTPLKIPLHSNVRWGSAYNMLERAYHLRQVRTSNSDILIIDIYIDLGDQTLYRHRRRTLWTHYCYSETWKNRQQDLLVCVYDVGVGLEKSFGCEKHSRSS
jgi:hypothetical protein